MEEELKCGIHFVSQATTPEEAFEDFIKAICECGNPGCLVHSVDLEAMAARKENEDKG